MLNEIQFQQKGHNKFTYIAMTSCVGGLLGLIGGHLLTKPIRAELRDINGDGRNEVVVTDYSLSQDVFYEQDSGIYTRGEKPTKKVIRSEFGNFPIPPSR